MRGALRLVKFYGVEHLEAVATVRAEQERLYGLQLSKRLAGLLSSEDVDMTTLIAVNHTAAKRGLEEIQSRALSAASARVLSMQECRDLEGLLDARRLAVDDQWHGLLSVVDEAAEEVVLARALEAAAAADDLAALRAVEQRAGAKGHEHLVVHAQARIREVAGRIGERMGLPAEWDVVLELAGADGARLLKKAEETDGSVLQRVQLLVDFTYTGWGGYGKRTRTRDRGKERVAQKLKVMSVVRVQNAESYVNYRAKRKKIEDVMRGKTDVATGEFWDVKTAHVSLAGAGGSGTPVDPLINEHYLWHGTDAAGADAITDSFFDLKRAGSKYGALFGPGIYLAESCMKADEYAQADGRGWHPLLLCRAALGRVNYCDAKEPAKLGAQLEASCKPGGHFDSVLGDREKVVKTFREFIVFDSHQVYPEFIVWYSRIYPS
mmetsp:Transcript_56974/g.166833  ORF Transcript_56974/g.166833 Transcript_56974/m.166833 type:complete len:436 (-) Transcript_56974:121-1428(-)